MKRILKYTWILGIVFFSSCGNWLDVEPSDQVSEEQQYSKAEGFYNQLNGIYKTVASQNLYGKELTWGFLDVLAQYYNMETSECENYGYRNGAVFKYEDKEVKPYFDRFWEKMYNTIANCNNLIQNVTIADSTLFPLRTFEQRCIEGEARALRAMLHFDLLRMYAPAPRVDSTGKYMPYVDVFPTHIPLNIPTNEFLAKVQQDLMEAHKLTANYDTIYRGNISNITYRLGLTTDGTLPRFMNHRGYRLNHYAIKGLLARVALYRGNKEEAIYWAKETLKYRKWFPFNAGYEIEYDHNVKLYGDVLFALYNNNATKYEQEENTGTSRMVANDFYTLFTDEDEYDSRRWQWREESDGEMVPVKFKKVESADPMINICNLMLPMIRMSEMYYILAECYYEKDKTKAETYLNAVRNARDCDSELPETSSQDDFNHLILRDLMRELYGEGQLFFFYKRLGMDALGYGEDKIQYGKHYVFPIPESNDI